MRSISSPTLSDTPSETPTPHSGSLPSAPNLELPQALLDRMRQDRRGVQGAGEGEGEEGGRGGGDGGGGAKLKDILGFYESEDQSMIRK